MASSAVDRIGIERGGARGNREGEREKKLAREEGRERIQKRKRKNIGKGEDRWAREKNMEMDQYEKKER